MITDEQAAPSTQVEQHEGLIAFFDILGYQSFLEAHSTLEKETNDVLAAILNVKREVPALATALIGESISTPTDRFRWLVFSDTILIAVPQKANADQMDKAVDFVWLVFTASILQRYMFDFGMPLRGAITQGAFLLAETCFAGKPIVDAYRLASSLNLAGCVIEKKLEESATLFMQSLNLTLARNANLAKYLVPLSNGVEEEYQVILPSTHLVANRPSWRDVEIGQLVAEAFWKHRKQISQTALQKLSNTELFMRFVKMQKGPDFQ